MLKEADYEIIVQDDGGDILSQSSVVGKSVESAADIVVYEQALQWHRRTNKLPAVIYEDRGNEVTGVYATIGNLEVIIEQL